MYESLSRVATLQAGSWRHWQRKHVGQELAEGLVPSGDATQKTSGLDPPRRGGLACGFLDS